MKKILLILTLTFSSLLLFSQESWYPQRVITLSGFSQRDSLKKEFSENWLIKETMYENEYEIHLRQPIATELTAYMNDFLGIVTAKEINKYSLEVTLAEWYIEKGFEFPVIRSGLQIYFAGKQKNK